MKQKIFVPMVAVAMATVTLAGCVEGVLVEKPIAPKKIVVLQEPVSRVVVVKPHRRPGVVYVNNRHHHHPDRIVVRDHRHHHDSAVVYVRPVRPGTAVVTHAHHHHPSVMVESKQVGPVKVVVAQKPEKKPEPIQVVKQSPRRVKRSFKEKVDDFMHTHTR